jgi:hypothetical protein
MGHATGQFGKNHLGDFNKYLPTVHGFNEFFGYLYHLDAMEDPFWHSYPPELKDVVGPRNLVHADAERRISLLWNGLLRARVLTLRLRAKACRRVRPNVHPIPAMQKGASFDMEAVKEQIQAHMERMQSN